MPCSNLRLLLVEDHEFQRQVFSQMLRTLGATTVHEAADGVEAMKILGDRSQLIDVVISDLDMPHMDGIEFIRHMGEAGSRASLILVSAVARDLLESVANIARAYEIPLLGVIRKPVTAVTLVPLLERHRRRRPEPSEGADRLTVNDVVRGLKAGEFEPWFEPEADLLSGQVHSLSVIPRWRHPRRGMLDAADFMAIVQANDLQDELTWALMRRSVEQCRRLNDAGHQVVVGIPLSFASLTTADLAVRIQQVAQAAGLAPRFVRLSVTETVLKTEQAKGLENLARLRIMGFALSVEDFGAGKMAIEQLALVAFTDMGISSTFVHGADVDDSVRAGLAASLDFAQRMRIKATASGIKSRHEWDLLYKWGCQRGRGPIVSAPLESAEVAEWLSIWQAQHAETP